MDNTTKIDLTLWWIFVFVALLVPTHWAVNLQNNYEKVRANRDSLAAAWLNCAEGYTQVLWVDDEHQLIDCKPVRPVGGIGRHKRTDVR